MKARAEARFQRVSAQKARLVVDEIRGLHVADAISTLRFTNKRDNVDVDKLFIIEAYVNEGPRQKRIRPAPMGRAYRYQRRTAHIALTVADEK